MDNMRIKCDICKKYNNADKYDINCDDCNEKSLLRTFNSTFNLLFDSLIEKKYNSIYCDYWNELNSEEEKDKLMKWHKNGFEECMIKICSYIEEYWSADNPKLKRLLNKVYKITG